MHVHIEVLRMLSTKALSVEILGGGNMVFLFSIFACLIF